jgi:hypothetical protein
VGRHAIFRAFLRALPLVLAAAAGSAGAGRADAPTLAWQAPSPAAGSVVTAPAGSRLVVKVSAGEADPTAVVRIKAGHLPRGAKVKLTNGNPASAAVSWKPLGRQIGDHVFSFSAHDVSAPVAAPQLTFTVRVTASYRRLSGVGELSRWSYVARPTLVRAAPRRSSSAIARLGRYTPEFYPNLVLALEQQTDRNGTWVRIRLPILPNNRTGWVKRGALGRFHAVWTHLIVNRSTTTATLYRNGRPIFRTPGGVGQRQWPTPRGEFYIRERLTGFHNAAYGPLAFGTSARSSVLTDWPGGGFIGIHGTNAPGLIPGHISHGCIRLRNAAILRLARLMPVGTPLTVS